MVDVSGIPNMGFGGGAYFAGGGGYTPPVNYSAQNQANLNYVNNVSQASYNPTTLYGPGGFGGLTDAYSAAGAAYGRATGYYGDTSGLPPGQAPSPNQGPPAPDMTPWDPWGNPAQANQSYGNFADFNQLWANRIAPTIPSGAESFNGMPIEDYFTALTKAYQPQTPYGPSYFNDTFNSANAAVTSAEQQRQGMNAGSAWQYLQANPDVESAATAAGGDPLEFAEQHYLNRGQLEGRNGFGMVGSATQDYLNANPDVKAAAEAAGGDTNLFALWHYANIGHTEDRSLGLPTGDAAAYLNANPDVAAAARASGMDPNVFAQQHYITQGYFEGRAGQGMAGNPEEQYLAANPDVEAAALRAGGDQGLYAREHYFDQGVFEGRQSYGMQPAPAGAYNFFSPANEYSTFQAPATPIPWWQKGGGNNPNILGGINSASFSLVADPAALGALFQEESGWNPRNGVSGGNYGIAQMAPNDFKTAGGTLGGLTYQQYQNADPADQIYSYTDFASRNLARAGIQLNNYDAPTQYAILQGLNFNPQANASTPWVQALLRGDLSVPTSPSTSQARDLGNLSLGTMAATFRSKAQ